MMPTKLVGGKMVVLSHRSVGLWEQKGAGWLTLLGGPYFGHKKSLLVGRLCV
jgi:hypothetical protein